MLIRIGTLINKNTFEVGRSLVKRRGAYNWKKVAKSNHHDGKNN